MDMDLATVFCPNPDCPARGQTGQGNIGLHSRQEQRLICQQCRKTFTATKGTAFYRLRTPTETVSLVLTLLAHGCPLQAIVIAFGFDERTVASWGARAGSTGQAVQEQSGRASVCPGAGASRRDPRQAPRGHRVDGLGDEGAYPLVACRGGQRAARHGAAPAADRAGTPLCRAPPP